MVPYSLLLKNTRKSASASMSAINAVLPARSSSYMGRSKISKSERRFGSDSSQCSLSTNAPYGATRFSHSLARTPVWTLPYTPLT